MFPSLTLLETRDLSTPNIAASLRLVRLAESPDEPGTVKPINLMLKMILNNEIRATRRLELLLLESNSTNKVKTQNLKSETGNGSEKENGKCQTNLVRKSKSLQSFPSLSDVICSSSNSRRVPVELANLKHSSPSNSEPAVCWVRRSDFGESECLTRAQVDLWVAKLATWRFLAHIFLWEKSRKTLCLFCSRLNYLWE